MTRTGEPVRQSKRMAENLLAQEVRAPSEPQGRSAGTVPHAKTSNAG